MTDDLFDRQQQFLKELYELNEQQLELAFLFAEGYRDFRYHEKGRYWIADKSFGNESEEIYRLHQILRVCDVDCRHHLTAYQYPYYTDNLLRLMQQRHLRLGWGRNGEYQLSSPYFYTVRGDSLKQAFQRMSIFLAFSAGKMDNFSMLNFDKSRVDRSKLL